MSTYIIMGILIILSVLGTYSYIRKLLRGESCCTTGDAPVKKFRVADRDKKNYPYAANLTISGMTCANCATRVENSLNSLPGIWAQVDLGRRTALVRGKQELDHEGLSRAVRQSGYIVTDIKDNL